MGARPLSFVRLSQLVFKVSPCKCIIDAARLPNDASDRAVEYLTVEYLESTSTARLTRRVFTLASTANKITSRVKAVTKLG